jgi:hypothetical protein
MGLQVHKFRIGDNVINLKMKKEIAKRFAIELSQLNKLNHYWREISGTVEEPETHSTTQLMSMFSPSGNPIKNPDKWKSDTDEFFKGLPELITMENVKDIMKRYNDIWNEHIPVVDKRKTKEQIKTDNEQYVKLTKEINEKNREDAEYKEKLFNIVHPEKEEIEKRDNEMFITVEVFFNDSDTMTDYFHPHSSLSPEYAIAVVPKQARKEAIVRNIISKIPELSNLNWKWKVEEWSMGHGTYMESNVIGEVNHKSYDGREKVAYWYEISFESYENKLTKSKYFIEAKPGLTSQETTEGATVRKNEEKNGVEVVFQDKPAPEILEQLKTNGFRWSRFAKLWYCRYSEEKYNFALNLIS